MPDSLWQVPQVSRTPASLSIVMTLKCALAEDPSWQVPQLAAVAPSSRTLEAGSSGVAGMVAELPSGQVMVRRPSTASSIRHA